MKYVLILLFAVFSLLSSQLMAQYTTEEGNAARTLWLKGFDIYEKAETSEKNNDKNAALSLYRDSTTYFQKVKNQYPKWNSALVEYRLKICERKTRTLEAETSSGQAAAPGKAIAAPPDPEKEIKQLKEKNNLLDKQLREIQNRLDLTLLSLNEARKEAALGSKSKEEIQSVIKEKNELEKKCALVSDELKRLQENKVQKPDDTKWNDKLDAERKISTKLKEENIVLSTKNEEIKAQYQKAASDKMELDFKLTKLAESQKANDEKLAQSAKTVGDLNARLKSSEKNKAALEGDLKDVQAKLDKQKEENTALSKNLKELVDNPSSSDLARQLQADNEKLKKDLGILSAKMEREALERNKVDEVKKKTLAKLEQVESILIDTKNENTKYASEVENLRKKAADSTSSSETYQKNITQLSTENKSLKTEVESLAANIEKMSKKEKYLAELTTQCALLEEKNRKLAESGLASAKENANLKTALETSGKDFQAKLDRNRQEIEELNSKVKKLADNPESSELAKQLQASNEKMQKERLEQGRKIVSIQMTVDSQAKEIAVRTKELESAKADIDAKTGEIAKNTGLSKKYQELQKTCEEFSLKNAELAKLNSELQKKQSELSSSGDAIAKAKNEVVAQKEKELQAALKTASASSDKALDDSRKMLLAKSEEASKLGRELKDVKAQIELSDKIRIERDELKMKMSQKNAEIENLRKANGQAKDGKTVTVERVIKEVVKENPRSANEEQIKLLLKSGEESEKKGKKEAAIWHYEKVLSLDMENQVALTKLAFIYSDQGDDAMTLKYLERALCYEPYDVQKLLVAAFAYIRKGDYYLALGVLSRAAAMDPKNPELQRYLGVACSNLGWIEAADRQFRSAYELDPKSSETAFNLAVLLATSEPPKMDEARKWYKKAKELGAETDPGMEKLFKE
ncbi:MAG: hypothetical protein WAX69_04935 [Victivallales bacterium]